MKVSEEKVKRVLFTNTKVVWQIRWTVLWKDDKDKQNGFMCGIGLALFIFSFHSISEKRSRKGNRTKESCWFSAIKGRTV